MSETIVQRKTAKLIQQELSEILSRQLQFGAGGIVTVSVVRVSRDIGLAKIYLSVFPDNKLESMVEELNGNKWELRHQLAQRIRNKVRKIPDLQFYGDDSFVEADRITKVLDDLEIPEDDEVTDSE